jgi:hypothetical protein
MKRTLMVILALAPDIAFSQSVPDHLQCYRSKDTLKKATYTADVAGLILEPGCRVKVPAKLTCVPATKTNVSPPPSGGGPSGIPNGFNCYVVKCPKSTLPTLSTQDQFGTRTVTPGPAKLLCAPFVPPTTSTTSTTTTTLPPTCAPAGTIGCGQPCAGTCRCMGPGTNQFCSGVHCGSVDKACVNVNAPAGVECSFDGACPAGQACVAASPMTCSSTVGGPGHCFPICPE